MKIRSSRVMAILGTFYFAAALFVIALLFYRFIALYASSNLVGLNSNNYISLLLVLKINSRRNHFRFIRATFTKVTDNQLRLH